MAEWHSIGVFMYGSINGAAFDRAYNFPEGNSFALSYRFGKDSLLNAKRGQVIRAIDFAGDFDRMATDLTGNITVFAGVGATRQRYGVTIPLQGQRDNPRVANNQWAINVPDTSVPIGLLRQGAGDVNTNQWAGASTSAFVVLTFGPTGRKPNLARQRYYVSPKPQWNAAAPSALTQGQSGQASVTVRYPDGEPVAGLRLRFHTENERVALIVAGQATFSHVVDTDSQGVASLPLTVLDTGASAVYIDLADERCDVEYFDPPFGAVLPLNAQTAMVGGQLCVVIPPVPEKPRVPSTYEEVATFQWDAGAYSYIEESGDCEITITEQSAVVGAVVGFVQTTENVEDYTRISHGFYFSTGATGAPIARVVEFGRAITTPTAYNTATEFRIQRAGNQVTYIIDGEKIYSSRVPLAGPVRAGCSLFGTGDSV